MNLIRRAAARIYDGSIVVFGRTARWPWQNKDWRSRSGRTAWVCFVGFVWWQMVQAYAVAMSVSIAVFLIVAFRAAVKTVDAGEQPERPADEEQDELTADEFVWWLRDLIADGPGAHLAEIAEQLFGDPRATGQVRGLCAAARVPIAGGTRSAGRPGVSTGVRRGDLPAPPPAPSDPRWDDAVADDFPMSAQQQQQQQRIVPHPDGHPNHWKVEP